jgi:hypothetical protein
LDGGEWVAEVVKSAVAADCVVLVIDGRLVAVRAVFVDCVFVLDLCVVSDSMSEISSRDRSSSSSDRITRVDFLRGLGLCTADFTDAAESGFFAVAGAVDVGVLCSTGSSLVSC